MTVEGARSGADSLPVPPPSRQRRSGSGIKSSAIADDRLVFLTAQVGPGVDQQAGVMAFVNSPDPYHRAVMELGETLDVRTPAAWRAWLKRNHARKKEIWLVLHAKASDRTGVGYNDAVDEALCFGWIDSTVKKVGPLSRAQRFTPRREGSPVSEMNKARARRLVRERRMTASGRAALGSALRREPLVVAPDVRRALRAEPGTWERFEKLPMAYKRIRLGFIEGARGRPQVFATRLRYFARMTAQRKRFGMVRG